MHGQTKLQSIIESIVNIVVGLGLAVLGNFIVLRHQGYDVSWYDMGWVSFWMTILSFIRSYTLRRIFNRIQLNRLRKENTQ